MVGTKSTCDTVIPIENVIIFKKDVGAFDVVPICIEREDVWGLLEYMEVE